MNGLGGDEVVVIQHEGEVLCLAGAEVVGQEREHGLQRRRLRRLEQCECRGADARVKRLQGGNQVGEETHRLVVLRL